MIGCLLQNNGPTGAASRMLLGVLIVGMVPLGCSFVVAAAT